MENVAKEITDDVEKTVVEEQVEEENEEASDEEEVVVTIGDEEEGEKEEAPSWVKELRQKNREQSREIRKLKKEQEEREKAKENLVVGEKPVLADYDFDNDKYDAALLSWNEKKRKADKLKKEREEQERKQQEEWQAKLDSYKDRKRALELPNFDEVEEEAKSSLSQIQQGIIISAADNPALMIYALGKSEAQLEKLSKITDPVKFAVEVGKVEERLKMTKKKKGPAPEKMINGSGSKSGATNKTLDALREEAERTGDYTKVLAYKRDMKKSS